MSRLFVRRGPGERQRYGYRTFSRSQANWNCFTRVLYLLPPTTRVDAS